VGGGWGEKRVSASALAPGISATGDTSGFLGGGQIGCNLQIGGNWVIGVEGEASAANIEGDITQTVLGITGTAHAQTDWLASATGRIGWSWDRWLIYAKGGAAWGGDKYSGVPMNPASPITGTQQLALIRDAAGSVGTSFWSRRRETRTTSRAQSPN